ncbi:capsule biosynthesis protein [Tropicimonas sp. S265A]|uniref:capsule biosynthesis protein n=1 Tax=Tropicimonas sp. S265A TaxID=3415134 RepID=UPI003C79B6CC
MTDMKPISRGPAPQAGAKSVNLRQMRPRPPAPAPKARLRRRHHLVLASFVCLVLAPILVAAWYLWTRAVDQYASFIGFSVRAEEVGSPIQLLGGVTDLSGSSSSDADILYKFLTSQELVARIDRTLDLRAIWSKVPPGQDPVFSYAPPGTIEDLLAHWSRKVTVYYDTTSGLIDLRVLAFAPGDAQAIAQQIFEESSAMINALSDLARQDAIGYARSELDQAEDRLRAARLALNSFRNRTQIVDPTIDAQGQMGLLSTLQAELAGALIDMDLLREVTVAQDPRLVQAARRIAVIETRIAEERQKLGLGGQGGGGGTDPVFANLVGEYETLLVELEFAEQSYTTALAAHDAARHEAQRQSRYLAAHVTPTLAEKAEYPQRWMILSLLSLFAVLGWSVLVLVGYALRDRR